jgi:hypothetical protein
MARHGGTRGRGVRPFRERQSLLQKLFAPAQLATAISQPLNRGTQPPRCDLLAYEPLEDETQGSDISGGG